MGAALVGAVLVVSAAAPRRRSSSRIKDYATAPMTGSTTGTAMGSLARINMLREEPGGAGRFLRERPERPAVHPRPQDRRSRPTWTSTAVTTARALRQLPFEAGFATGSSPYQFDPDYRRNGKFYTIHLEEPAAPGSVVPDATTVPGLNVTGYTPTPPITTPGSIDREAIVIEWTDTNVSNAAFEGSARELMRLQLNTRIHPMGDLIFNPTARPGDTEWRVLYIGCGDGGSGERDGNAAEPAAPRHARWKDHAHRARSRPPHRNEHGHRERAATVFPSTTRSPRLPARERRVWRTLRNPHR